MKSLELSNHFDHLSFLQSQFEIIIVFKQRLIKIKYITFRIGKGFAINFIKNELEFSTNNYIIIEFDMYI